MQEKMIAMQVGAVSFADEGTEQVLDILQEKGMVNTLFLANFTYTRGTGGRPFPGFPLADHGVQDYDHDYVGGNFGTGHAPYYRNTFIRAEDFQSKDHGSWDMMAEVIPAAHRRGMKVYSWIEESAGKKGAIEQSRRIPNFAQVLEIDARGRKAKRPCFNHPDYRNWHFGLIEDYIKSYDIDGVAWGSERQGPLGNMLGGRWATGEITCFCEHCRARARERGINVERARQGFLELDKFIRNARSNMRPNDGYFVSFWRLLLQFPEILAWESLWHDGQQQFFREIYGMVKAIRPEVQVGWHIYHLHSFSPFHRATQDLGAMSHYSDFLKLVVYNNCAGARYTNFIEALHNTIFKDAKPDEGVKLISRFLDIDEGPWEEMHSRKWSSHYVRKETERALSSVNQAGNATRIIPGIDVDIPTDKGESLTQPDDVYQAVTAALEAGGNGVILSRKYSEMRLANIEACGRAIQDYTARSQP